MKKIIVFGILISLLSSCRSGMDLQGHRGCRGLLPENTTMGFLKALELGVTTLEMDVVISKDDQIVVSHEPFFSHEISIDPNGELIDKDKELEYNMYEMTYAEIAAFDVGSRTHERFPYKEKIKAKKPLLSEVIQAVESAVKSNGYKKPFYNIEIKRNPKYDNQYHPDGAKFAKLVVEAIQKTGIKKRIFIQSFDTESLQLVKALDPKIKLVLLIENKDSAQKNLKELGFVPIVYSPYFKLVDEDLVAFCKKEKMKLIPWTVNEREYMLKMIDLKVDGIITDYPNVLVDLLKEKKIRVK